MRTDVAKGCRWRLLHAGGHPAAAVHLHTPTLDTYPCICICMPSGCRWLQATGYTLSSVHTSGLLFVEEASICSRASIAGRGSVQSLGRPGSGLDLTQPHTREQTTHLRREMHGIEMSLLSTGVACQADPPCASARRIAPASYSACT